MSLLAAAKDAGVLMIIDDAAQRKSADFGLYDGSEVFGRHQTPTAAVEGQGGFLPPLAGLSKGKTSGNRMNTALISVVHIAETVAIGRGNAKNQADSALIVFQKCFIRQYDAVKLRFVLFVLCRT